MQVVIDVPKEYYKAITEIPYHQCTADMLIIKNGTPLPKGHGRLIDADRLWDSYHDLGYDFYEAFDLAETIIETDTESENYETCKRNN